MSRRKTKCIKNGIATGAFAIGAVFFGSETIKSTIDYDMSDIRNTPTSERMEHLGKALGAGAMTFAFGAASIGAGRRTRRLWSERHQWGSGGRNRSSLHDLQENIPTSE